MPLPATAHKHPHVPFKKGKSCKFHLPSLKKMYAYLNSFPLYFFLFQNKTLMGSASISLQEMRHNNLDNDHSSFLSILSGKFKLYTMEGFESGSIECDFRLRHITAHHASFTSNLNHHFQSVQHLRANSAVSSRDAFVVDSFSASSRGADNNFAHTPTGGAANQAKSTHTPSNQLGTDTLTSHDASLPETRAHFRNTREVNDILKLVDLYNTKQNDAKAIKETLEYTISDMKQQLTVIERALGGTSTKKTKKRNSAKRKSASSTRHSSMSVTRPTTYTTHNTTSGTARMRPQSARQSTAKILKSNRLLPTRDLQGGLGGSTRGKRTPTTPASKGISKIKIHSTKQKRKPTPATQSHFVVGRVEHSASKQTAASRRLSYSSSSSSSSSSSNSVDFGAKYSAEDFEEDMEKVGDKDFMHNSAEFKETKDMAHETEDGSIHASTAFTVREATNTGEGADNDNRLSTDFEDEDLDDEFDDAPSEKMAQSQEFEVKEARKEQKVDAVDEDFDLDEEFDLDDFDPVTKSRELSSSADIRAPAGDENRTSADEYAADEEFDDILDDVGDEF